MNLEVKVLNLSLGPHKLSLPKYATEGDDAVDLMACFNLESNADGTAYYSLIRDYDSHNTFHDVPVYCDDEFILKPKHRALISTGLKVDLPLGWKLSIKSRSGLSLKSGIRVMNSPGTVDSPYRGIIGVILINDSDENFSIRHGDRVAQMSLEATNEIKWLPVMSEEELSKTERGDGGYGHSGIEGTETKVIMVRNDSPEPEISKVDLNAQTYNNSDIETNSSL